MYHYLEPYCKVPILAKYKKIACVTVQTPPPLPLKGAAVHRLLKKEFKRFWRKQFLVQKWGYGKKDSNCYNISESLVKIRKDKQSWAKMSKYMYHDKCAQMQKYKATHARSWEITAILIIRTITKGYFDLTWRLAFIMVDPFVIL